jgi:hypothetical protein
MPHVHWFDGAQVSYVAHVFAGRPAEAVAMIDVQQGARSQQQARHPTWAQRSQVGQALAAVEATMKISTTITSTRGTS